MPVSFTSATPANMRDPRSAGGGGGRWHGIQLHQYAQRTYGGDALSAPTYATVPMDYRWHGGSPSLPGGGRCPYPSQDRAGTRDAVAVRVWIPASTPGLTVR